MYSLERSKKRNLGAVNERRRMTLLSVEFHSPAKQHALLLVEITNNVLTGAVNTRLRGAPNCLAK